MKINSIALFCGSAEGNNPKYTELAQSFGTRCASLNCTLYYGGASVGLMRAAAKACHDAGGKIVGIAPDFFSKGTVLDTSLQELHLVRTMSERKQKFEILADAFVALPGSYGTMDELFEALTNAQLGLHQKPVALLNAFGYYDHLILLLKHFHQEGFLKDFHLDLLIIASTIDELFDKLSSYTYNNDRHWLSKIKK